ncbi:type I restriction-modification system subunit M, partial [Vibrio sp. 10N.261.49.A5]
GEFYTPQQVSKILAKLVSLSGDVKSVYDPTCGSGSLLLRVAKEVSSTNLEFCGQEQNPSTFNLARMNMLMHGVRYDKFDIKNDDTLEHPMHTDKRFDAVVANPPFSANWSASDLHLNDERFADYGKLAPKTKADFAFVLHMVHQLNDTGTLAVVVPHGILFRGAAEGHIRKHLIENKNYLDAVIGLPAGIFFGTSIPTCILVFKKNRNSPERKENSADNVLFIDASNHFEKGKAQNHLREEDVTRIVEAYNKRESVDKYSHVAELSEIAENDYNLNIPRYVDTFEEEEAVDLDAVATDLTELETKMHSVDTEIADFCAQLNIKAPF